jgi:hypothetical protein
MFILTLMLVLASFELRAQVSFGIAAGMNQSTMEYRDPVGNASETKSPLRRFNCELLAYFPVVEGFYIIPAIRLVTKGANLTANHSQGGQAEYTRRLDVRYLEIPVSAAYKIPVSFGRITVGAGPYAAYGMCGNNRLQVYNTVGTVVSTNDYDVEFSRHVNKGIYPGTRLNRWDVGGQVIAGVEFNNLIMVGLHYSRGIRNLDLSGNSMIRNSSMGVSIGYLLSREDY